MSNAIDQLRLTHHLALRAKHVSMCPTGNKCDILITSDSIARLHLSFQRVSAR